MTDTAATTAELEVRERGPGQSVPPPVGELPAGGAQWPVPHHLSKIGVINQLSRAYRWTYDEALRHSRQNAVAMLRDTQIRKALKARLIPTAQLEWHLEARDETDPRQVEAVKKLTAVLKQTPRLQDLHTSLLMAVWYGRAGAQLLWEWDYSHPDGERRLVIKDHRPINGDSLVARWSGDWGQLVNGLYDGEREPTDRGFAHFYTAAEKEAVLVHLHDPEDCDYQEPELAGQVRGSGVRGHVYWYWWLASNFMALAEDYAERFANGLWKAYFDESNPNAKTELEQALAAYRSSHVLTLPRGRGDQKAVNDVTVEQVSTANPAFLFEIVQWLWTHIREYISGSMVSSEMAVAAGGDALGVDEDRVSRVIKYDAERLAEMYSIELLPTMTRYNCGEGVPPPYFRFSVDRPNAGALLNYAKALIDLGGTVDLEPLYEACGIGKGQPGGTVANKLQPLSPTAVDQTPIGTPVGSSTGQPQPDPQSLQQQPQPAPQQQPTAAAEPVTAA